MHISRAKPSHPGDTNASQNSDISIEILSFTFCFLEGAFVDNMSWYCDM